MRFGRYRRESADHAALRDELLAAEIALRDQRERVAELRRKLPADPIGDYALREESGGGVGESLLSQLFESPEQPLVLVHFMFGGAQRKPCPMCTCWADGYDGIVPHLRQRVNFAVAVAGDIGEFAAFGRGRGWRHLRLVSSGGSTLKADLGFEDAEGNQFPGVSVFARRGGELRHAYSGSALLGEAGGRGMDLLNPLWHFLDLTPDGRGEFLPELSY